MKALKLYYRTLSRNKVFSLISIGGFSLCLATVVAILTVSWQSWGLPEEILWKRFDMNNSKH